MRKNCEYPERTSALSDETRGETRAGFDPSCLPGMGTVASLPAIARTGQTGGDETRNDYGLSSVANTLSAL